MLKVKERGYLIHKFPYAFGEGKGVHEREREKVFVSKVTHHITKLEIRYPNGKIFSTTRVLLFLFSSSHLI